MSQETGLITTKDATFMSTIDTADLADSTKTKYKRALGRYLDTGAGVLDANALAQYVSGEDVSNTDKAHLSAAIRIIVKNIKRDVMSRATPDAESVAHAQALLWRAEALNSVIDVPVKKGQKIHFWLSPTQVKALLENCDTSTLAGKRDKLALGLMVAAGLRRNEAVNLTFEHVKLLPVKTNGQIVMRTVLTFAGKGDKDRVIPLSDALAAALDEWAHITGGAGRVLRSIDRRGELRDSISGVALFHIVRKYGTAIDLPKLAPHDLRRTYAELGKQAGIDLTQLSVLLGHASSDTTRLYLNLNVNLETTVSDFIPF